MLLLELKDGAQDVTFRAIVKTARANEGVTRWKTRALSKTFKHLPHPRQHRLTGALD